MGVPAKYLESSQQGPGDAPLAVSQQEMGRADTLRYNIVTYVVEENYDRAIQELKLYLEGESEFPQFKGRIERYIAHSVDLINAIRAKRKFPGASNLTMAKQQELNDRFREHFDELQDILKQIEKVQTELQVQDIRSTVWVIRAAVNGVFAVFVVALMLEAQRGLFVNFWVVADDYIVKFLDITFNFLNL